MNILFISIAWPAPGEKNLYTDLMEEFVAHGHSVYVLATQNSNKSIRAELNRENGIIVLRIFSGKIRKTSYLRKITSLFTLGRKMRNYLKQYFNNHDFELIIGHTPPITLSKLYKELKKHYSAPFYLLLKDIWPQGSIDLGVIKKNGIAWKYLRFQEISLYKTADYIGCMSILGAEYLLKHNEFLAKEKIEVCPNSIQPTPERSLASPDSIREKYNIPEGACVFICSGNLGVGHGLHFLIDSIRSLSDYPKAYFIIGGAGTQYTYLKKKFDKLQPSNAFLYSWLSRGDFDKILASSDVGLILLYKYTSPQFPSRLLSYLEYSKPVLCAINPETDMGDIVESAKCGTSVLHGDMGEFTEAIRYYCENEKERKIMGVNGRKLLMEQFTVKHSYDIIMSHFDNINSL